MEKLKINRKIEINNLFKISQMKEVIKPTKPHKHDGYYEVILLTEGAGFHFIDENRYEVTPPVLFFMNPGCIHYWEFYRIPKGFVCMFKDTFLDQTPDIKLKLLEFSPCYHLIEQKVNLLSDFEHLFREYERAHPENNVLRSYLNVILWKIASLPSSSSSFRLKNALVVSFCNLVNNYFITHKDVGFYADKLGVSKRTLSNVVKKETGRTATSLIYERIIEESKRLLLHTNNSVSEIAYHLNFNDPSHFIKFFRKKTNLSPGEFRSLL